MLTGLVYAAVVVLWAVVLVPQWLRRHDRHAEHRSAMRFRRAMHTLDRRRSARGVSRAPHHLDVSVTGSRSRAGGIPGSGSSIPADQAADASIDLHLDHGIDPFAGSREEDGLRQARQHRARLAARQFSVQRRRQVQQVLAGLSVIFVIGMFMGFVPVLLGILPPLGLAAFTYSIRQREAARRDAQLRREQRAARVAAAERRASADEPGRSPAARAASQRRRRAPSRVVESPSRSSERRSAAAVAGGSDVRLLSEQEIAQRTAAAAVGSRWNSDTVPASRDTDWTAQRMLEQAAALRASGADAESELGLDDFVAVPQAAEFEHRRAVND